MSSAIAPRREAERPAGRLCPSGRGAAPERRLAAARAGGRSRPRLGPARSRSRPSPGPGPAGGARRRRAVAQRWRHGRAAGGAGLAPGRRRMCARTRAGSNPRGSRLDRASICARRSRVRRAGACRASRRARRALRAARAVRRAEPRPARGAADRPQLLFGRHPRRADPGRLAARLEVGGAADRAPRPGAWRLAARGRAVGLGHRQYAHRRRRHRPGAGADRSAAGLGAARAAG